tara:strand:+ start:2519 stop:3166 length:648 start_codon:yes stop_codon:yes gene_type:complete
MDKHDTKNFNYISKFIVDGDVLVDVGAHLGVYSDFFLKSLNGTGKVYTLEPHPTNYDRLYRKYKNSDRLDSKTIVLENKAASDIDGIIDVYHDMGTQTQTTNIVGFDVNGVKVGKIGDVECTRLDTLLMGEEKIKLVKIDVEGAEIKVLEGLSGVIEKVSNLLVECHMDEDWGTIKDLLLNKYNFSCYDVQFESPVTIDTEERSYQCLCKKNNLI